MGQKTGRRRLKGLSKAAEAAVLKREVFGRLKLVRWLKILRELARYDEAGDLQRARLKKTAVISGVALVPLGILLAFLAGEEEPWFVSAVLGAAMLTAAILLIYCLVRNKRLTNLDLANDFRKVLIPFLTAIREDVPSKDKIKLKLDLAGPTDSKAIRKGAPTHRDGKKIQETVYSDSWCHLEASLVTGSRITLDISNLYTRRKVTSKNPRGKYKLKVKWKKLVVARAGMSPDMERYAFDPVAVERKAGEGELKLKKRVEGPSAALKMKRKFKSAGSPPSESIQPKEILGMFLRLESLMRPVSTGGQNT